MQKLLPLLLCVFFLFGCNSSQKSLFVNSEGEILKLRNPAGTVKIEANLYADKSEVSNLNYRGYTNWVKSIFGEKSETYQKSLPDTLVWITSGAYSEYYFHHPAYLDYPVVGVTYEQAVAYCDWRSDRWYERMLIERGIIEVNETQDSSNYFSIEAYLQGKYNDYQAIKTLPFSKYRLPTVEEWEFIASGNLKVAEYPYGYDESSKKWEKARKKYSPMYVVKSDELISRVWCFTMYRQETMVENNKGFPNDLGIFHTIGNAAEMTAEKGIAKGGSWCHLLKESTIEANIQYDKPEKWLGFRCVCSWENPKN